MMLKVMVGEKPIILLVDDDPNDEELARIALEAIDIPHELVIKRDGAEVLDWFGNPENLRNLPQLILLDLKLPKVMGLEVLERLRTNPTTKHAPVVIFTSSSEIRDQARSYALGASAYVRKPVDFTQYRETVQDMGRFWILRNQLPPRETGS